MTDQERNIRTLLVCFAVAIMVLVPLRFVEVGNQIGTWSNIQPVVLGEVSLVEDRVLGEPSLLEAPYNRIEGEMNDCLGEDEARSRVQSIGWQLTRTDLSAEDRLILNEELAKVGNEICR